MSDVENELQSRVDAFVSELSDLIRRQALEAVEEVLKKGGGEAAAVAEVPPPAKKPARTAEAKPRTRAKAPAAAAPAAPAAPAAKPVATPKRKAGEKRTPAQLNAITDQVFNYIKSNGGQGVEQIAKALATSTKELTLPIRKLLAEKKIGSKGQKRATRYFPR